MLNIDLNLVYNIINIIVLFLLLKKFLFKPVTEIMEKRQRIIEESMKEAESNRAMSEEAQLQYENTLKSAREEADLIVKEAKKRGEAEYEKKLRLAEEDAKLTAENAKKAISLEKEKALRDAKSEIASLAIMAASKIVEKDADSESDKKILDDFLSEAGELR